MEVNDEIQMQEREGDAIMGTWVRIFWGAAIHNVIYVDNDTLG